LEKFTLQLENNAYIRGEKFHDDWHRTNPILYQDSDQTHTLSRPQTSHTKYYREEIFLEFIEVD